MRRNQGLALAIITGAVLSACGGGAQPSLSSVTSGASASAGAADSPPDSASPATQPPSATAPEEQFADPVSAAGWREVAMFGGTNILDEPTSVTFGANQFVAVGRHYEYAPGEPGSIEGRIWLSSDGTSWEALPSDPVFKHATLTRVITASDGSLVVYGSIQPVTHMPDAIPVYATWRSADGRTWQRFEVESLARGVLSVEGVVQGRQGYVMRQAHNLSLGSGPSGGELWQSLDGLSWDLVYETADERIISLAGGDEGFVAVRSTADHRAVAIASADGREWIDGDALPEELTQASLAALGGDWVMVGLGSEGPPGEPGPVTPGEWDLPVWFSANGLAWHQVGSISWPGDGLGFAFPGPLVSVGDRLILSPFAAGGGPRLPSAGVWSSADGSTWETADIRSDVTVVDGAENAGTVVLVGYVGPGQSATFWLNERP